MLFDGFDFENQSDILKEQINTINKIKTSHNISALTTFNADTASEYANALKSIESSQAALLLSTQGLTKSQIAQTLVAKEGTTQKAYEAMANAGLLASQKKVSVAQLKSNLLKTFSTQMSQADAEAKTREIMVSMGLSSAFGKESRSVVKLNSKKLALLVQSGKLSEAQAMEIAMNNGVTLSMQRQTASVIPQLITKMKLIVSMLKEQAIATIKWLALKSKISIKKKFLYFNNISPNNFIFQFS